MSDVKSRVVKLSDFRGEVAAMPLPLFLERFPHPVLLLEAKEGDFGDPGFQTLATKAENVNTPEHGVKLPVADSSERDAGGSTDLDIQVKPRTAAGANPVAEKHADIHKQLLAAGSGSYVCPLVKRDVNKFASMITLGRSANNDLRMNLPSVSKFHAYFTHVPRDNSWYVADANSSNGTFLNGERLRADKGRSRVENGSAIRFGPDVVARFFDARSFYAFLHS